MDQNSWPAGVRPSGRGIRIFIWSRGKLVYSETVPGDPYKARDLAAAVQRREDLLSRQRLGLPLVESDQDSKVQLFADAAQDYINTLDAKQSTLTEYVKMLNLYWLPEFGNWPTHEITRAAIKRVLAGMNVTRKTKKNRLNPLSGVFEHAEIYPNPAYKIIKGKHQKPPVDRYTPEQRDALLSKLSGQALVYFSILFGCGLRPGEALGLDWSDYDGEELDISKQITRRRIERTTKTCVRRRVYVPTYVRQVLNNHPTRFNGGFIFLNSQGGPCLDTDTFNAAWRTAHKKARIPYRIPYTCRHTRAAELLSIGIEPARAAKELGHSLEIFFRTYAEFIEEFSGKRDRSDFEGIGGKKEIQR